jgi:hypothetical protein
VGRERESHAVSAEMPTWLLVVDVTVESVVEDDWNKWYNDIHLPEIAACPGFERAARYVSESGGGRRYLTIYAITGPEALEGEEFRSSRGWDDYAGRVQASVRTFRRLTEPR